MACHNLEDAVLLLTQMANRDEAEAWLRKVSQHTPTTFAGAEDPVALENWIQDLNRIFTAIFCPIEQRTKIASFYLRGVAEDWWNGLQELGGPPMSWDDFEAALRTRFFSETLRRKKLSEFMNFTQGTLSVREYYTRFQELLRFAPAIAACEFTVVILFERGLQFSIRRMMGANIFTTLASVYDMACIAADMLGEQTALRSKRPLTDVQSNDRRVQQRTRGPSGFQGHHGHGQFRPQGQVCSFVCKTCGRDHRNIWQGNLITCHTCGKGGHRSFDCRSGLSRGSAISHASAAPPPLQSQAPQTPTSTQSRQGKVQNVRPPQGRQSFGQGPRAVVGRRPNIMTQQIDAATVDLQVFLGGDMVDDDYVSISPDRVHDDYVSISPDRFHDDYISISPDRVHDDYVSISPDRVLDDYVSISPDRVLDDYISEM